MERFSLLLLGEAFMEFDLLDSLFTLLYALIRIPPSTNIMKNCNSLFQVINRVLPLRFFAFFKQRILSLRLIFELAIFARLRALIRIAPAGDAFKKRMACARLFVPS